MNQSKISPVFPPVTSVIGHRSSDIGHNLWSSVSLSPERFFGLPSSVFRLPIIGHPTSDIGLLTNNQ
ncbi:MAG: hypothetical protein Q8S14_18115 [Algoriphagus sp.]|uniref:hypothetical protein n=1 Tax=Algoriphagus sp. TaxID=1872435 RepID=UPI0027321967|nr:hypothetical protein [Algoriphagus sp.]MDP2041523.1 hypothetical protein [Algoriphagus sp.]MDP3473793.1 hypothetical protein [Algoriphagus sp.]